MTQPLQPPPDPTTVAGLLALAADPATAGRLASAARLAAHGAVVRVRHAAEPAPSDTLWPDPAALAHHQRLTLPVEHDAAPAYAAWLLAAAAHPFAWTLAPFCPRPGGLHRLWLLAAARLALPAHVRVEVRHDLFGIRLAHVALGFGADTLAGPIDPARHLPLAGVPRPSETSAEALCMLIRQAGLEPLVEPAP